MDVSKEWQAHQSSPSLQGNPISLSTGTVQAPQESADTMDCGCESLSPQERLEDSTYAFTGIVAEVQGAKKGKRTLVFDVDEIFKGTPKPEMKVTEELSGTACDLPFQEGQAYLVFTKWEWGVFTTSRCMGTKRLEKAKTAALGPSEQRKEKLYIQLHNACMGRLDTACCLASLKAMQAGYYVPEPEGGCPEGTVPDRLRCGGSYAWCIPLMEKDHRQTDH